MRIIILKLSAIIRKYYNVFYSNGINMIYRRVAENAERFGIFRLSLRRRQTKTIMPSAIGSHVHLAQRASFYYFSPFSAKRNKKNFLRELCVSNERSEWAVRQKIIRNRIYEYMY